MTIDNITVKFKISGKKYFLKMQRNNVKSFIDSDKNFRSFQQIFGGHWGR